MKKEMAELRQMVLELESGRDDAVTSIKGYLDQNAPNPVRSTTTIRYIIPEASTSAVLTLTNAKGQVVKTMSLNNRSIGQVNLNTQELASGTYSYTLYVDGKQVDSKRLVVAH